MEPLMATASSTAPHVIFGIHVIDRTQHAAGVQSVLTEFGENIKTRIGLHDVYDGNCSPNGLLLIEFIGDAIRCGAFAKRLAGIGGVEIKEMFFEHP
jgi:hypothetical protein